MVKDKKVDVIARDYTINLHKALHGMYAAPTRNSSSLGLGCAAPCAGGAAGLVSVKDQRTESDPERRVA